MEGNITKKAEFGHISSADVDNVLEHFRGTIDQIPPIFSAIRQGGKKLYEKARKGETADDVEIKSRQVEVHRIDALPNPELPKFEIEVECGGGTYIRSLIRDIGYKLDSVATTTYLERTKQGQFTTEDCLVKDDWNPDNIYAAIDRVNTEREETACGDE
jgi:tRNA pseudouridine55 synthase